MSSSAHPLVWLQLTLALGRQANACEFRQRKQGMLLMLVPHIALLLLLDAPKTYAADVPIPDALRGVWSAGDDRLEVSATRIVVTRGDDASRTDALTEVHVASPTHAFVKLTRFGLAVEAELEVREGVLSVTDRYLGQGLERMRANPDLYQLLRHGPPLTLRWRRPSAEAPPPRDWRGRALARMDAMLAHADLQARCTRLIEQELGLPAHITDAWIERHDRFLQINLLVSLPDQLALWAFRIDDEGRMQTGILDAGEAGLEPPEVLDESEVTPNMRRWLEDEVLAPVRRALGLPRPVTNAPILPGLKLFDGVSVFLRVCPDGHRLDVVALSAFYVSDICGERLPAAGAPTYFRFQGGRLQGVRQVLPVQGAKVQPADARGALARLRMLCPHSKGARFRDRWVCHAGGATYRLTLEESVDFEVFANALPMDLHPTGRFNGAGNGP